MGLVPSLKIPHQSSPHGRFGRHGAVLLHHTGSAGPWLPPLSFPLFTIIILKHPEAKHFCRTLKKSPQIPPLLERRC